MKWVGIQNHYNIIIFFIPLYYIEMGTRIK